MVLKSGVPSAVAQQVQQLALRGVYLDKVPIRQYPEGSLAAQILGFVGHDFTGLGGLELSYKDELAGTPGVIDTEQDTGGQEITIGRRLLTPPRQGSDLVLTLDRYVQRVAERLLNQAVLDNKASGGLILVMEPHTGNILAAANNPTYRPDRRRDLRPAARPTCTSAKIVTDQYEPGSTLKTLAMSAAIDLGLVTPTTTMEDTGMAIGRRRGHPQLERRGQRHQHDDRDPDPLVQRGHDVGQRPARARTTCTITMRGTGSGS